MDGVFCRIMFLDKRTSSFVLVCQTDDKFAFAQPTSSCEKTRWHIKPSERLRCPFEKSNCADEFHLSVMSIMRTIYNCHRTFDHWNIAGDFWNTRSLFSHVRSFHKPICPHCTILNSKNIHSILLLVSDF